MLTLTKLKSWTNKLKKKQLRQKLICMCKSMFIFPLFSFVNKVVKHLRLIPLHMPSNQLVSTGYSSHYGRNLNAIVHVITHSLFL